MGPALSLWLRQRTPEPPADLLTRIESIVGDQAGGAVSPERLLSAAAMAMTGLLTEGCLTRDSALSLLAVDSLVTYAFEAAADRPETIELCAERALGQIAALAAPYDA